MTVTNDLVRLVAQAALEKFLPKPPNPYLTDPVKWVEDKLGEHLWSKQRDICRAVVEHKKVAVRSCHNAGKTRVASRLAAWWIDTYGEDDGYVVSTAPTYAQVHGLLWEEIRKAAKAATARGNPLPGRVLGSDQWKLDDGTLVGWGRKPADTDMHGFQGVHHRHMLVIVDEACGVARQLWTAVEAITTGEHVVVLALGNPDDPNTEFGDVCKPGSGWHVIGVSAFDTPNLTNESLPEHLRPLMLSPDWVEDKKRWGIDSPRYVSKVLGQFPDLGTDTLISPLLIEAAQQRTLEKVGRGILGVDVARFGADRTVIYLRHGPVLRLFGEYAKQATTETTGRVIAAKRETGADEIRVDGVGVGGGVVDQLTEQGHGVLDMQAGGKARDSERFANARAEWAWTMKERLESGEADLDPADDDLAAQLGALKYRYNSRGQIIIESKEDARKRGLPSPDRADAAILTVVDPAGADLYPKLRWRFFNLVTDSSIAGRVSCGGSVTTLAEGWTYATTWLPTGEDAASDWAVAAVWTQTIDGNLLLRDFARARRADTSPAALISSLVRRCDADTTFVPRKQRTDAVRAEMSRAGVGTTELTLDGDLMARALAASTKQVAGKVWLPAGAPWAGPFTAECQAFPHGRNVGCVEVLAAAVHVAATKWTPPPPKASSASHRESDPFSALDGGYVDLMRAQM